jgi:type II secretory pathway component PulJ
MSRPLGPSRRVSPHAAVGQSGMTVIEVLVGAAVMALLASTIAMLLGVAVQSKMISSTRSADTETARATLGWMVERLRNAGLNLQPKKQSQLRCMDRIVAQDPLLLPTANRVYTSGEILKSDTVAGDEVLTVGYYLARDPETGNQAVLEYRQPCGSGPTSVRTYSAPLSNPKLNIRDLTFQYFGVDGTAITDLANAARIRSIAMIRISLTVETQEGSSGLQAQALTRSVRLWNPEPNTNNWINANEDY